MSTTKKQIPWSKLTVNERSVLAYLSQVPEAHISQIQADVIGDLGTGTSPTRNTLRRLVDPKYKNKYAVKVSRGVYAITKRGHSRIPKSVLSELTQAPVLATTVTPPRPPIIETPNLTDPGDILKLKVEEFLRLALAILDREGPSDRRGDERRVDERRGVDRRLHAPNGVNPQ